MKRGFDLLLIIGSAPFWLPLLAMIALVVRFKLGRPVIFCQLRAGGNGELFELWKFRTMAEFRDVQGRLLPDEQRLSAFGRWLRATSLDELPELFNVIQGRMSLVGPRPLLAEYWSRYTTEQKRRHRVKPGITGWAQVNGRNALCWEEKFRLDIWYVEHQSLWLDVKILALSLWRVVRREGISAPGQATMDEFNPKHS